MKIEINGVIKDYDKGSLVIDIAKNEFGDNYKSVLAATYNGNVVDLFSAINDDGVVELCTFDSELGKKAYRHSTSHVLAQAVKHLYPFTKIAIGPAIDDGFYYDFDFATPISMADIPAIENEMKKIIKARLPIVREEITRKEALNIFTNDKEIYKIELINDLPEDSAITLYRQGDYYDLCAGPHVPNTGYIKAFKLNSITGAYWRGSEKNKMLTRIYGTAFDTKENLEAFLAAQELARQRDHNKIGRELGYFMTDENIGQGLPLLMPKGAKVYQILSRFVEDEEERRGYILTKTPLMAKSKLYKISGHWDHYKDGMFVIGNEDENEVMALRPMTCPFQYTIYNNGLKSYRDLPLRYAETSTLFRNESSGEMHGLIRVRQFTISEGHLIVMPSQLEEEFKGCLNLAIYMLKAVGLINDISFRFSKWDSNHTDKYINDPEKWQKAESEMEKILNDLGLKYSIGMGEAAFYGPKLDIQVKNVFGKEDTLITIQVDMFLAERFDMVYVDDKGEKVRPYIIHRTSIGCYERTIALIIEKFGGALPVWLAPEQVRVLDLTDRTADDVVETTHILKKAGIRASYDIDSQKIGYKIRQGQLEKIPYMLIIGDKEKEANVVSVRSRKLGDIGTMSLDDFIKKVKQEVADLVLD